MLSSFVKACFVKDSARLQTSQAGVQVLSSFNKRAELEHVKLGSAGLHPHINLSRSFTDGIVVNCEEQNIRKKDLF